MKFFSSKASKSALASAAMLALGTLLAGPLHAAVIIKNVSGGSTVGGSGYQGHSFTMPAGTAYNTISFSWLGADGNTQLAAGGLFLLSAEYLGSPSGLSSSTPGYLATTTNITANSYIFNTAITLSPSTKYWVYMSGAASLAGGGYGAITPYAGGQPYEEFDGNTTASYHSNTTVDFNFLLSGNAVPEPSTTILAALGVVGVCAYRLRKARLA